MANTNTRITLEDNAMSAIMKLADGNPGAATVCIRLLKEAGDIDTNSFVGGLGTLLSLDTENVYGSEIWMLYKDVCKESLWKTVAVLRSCQIGFLSNAALHHAINNYGDGIDIDELVKQVTGQLSGFKIPNDD
ncbi:MAG: hypothetical protein PHG06_00565 [Parabacteroides sp.]|nr:hypothetical protein [Parabacteroides sp.]